MKKYFSIILLSILFGILYVMPQIFYQFSLGSNFRGVYRGINDDEAYYMSRAQDIVDSHYFLSNPYFAEYKDGQPMQFFLPDLILAFPALIFKINVYPLYEFYDFLLPAVAFFLLYLILFSLIKNRFWSAVISSWVMGVNFFPAFGRPISPQFVFVFVLTMTLLIIKLFDGQLSGRKKISWLIVLSAINFGLLFHFYTYFWTYFAVIFLFLFFYFAIKKDLIQSLVIFLVSVAGLIIGSYYFYQIWIASRSPFFAESISRLGMINTRMPSGIDIVIPALIILTVFLFYFFKKKKIGAAVSEVELFLFIGILSAIINVNQHIVTGKNLLFSSHYKMIADFFMIIGVSYILWQFDWVKNITDKRLLKFIIVIFILFLAVPNFLRVLKYDYYYEVKKQDYRLVFDWLNDNTFKDSVIMANNDLSAYIPSYTQNNVLFSSGGNLFFVSTGEIIDRFVVNNYGYKDFNFDFVEKNFNAFYGYYYDALAGKDRQLNLLRRIFGQPLRDINRIRYPSEKINEVINIKNKMTVNDWIMRIKKYSVSYVVINKAVDSDWVKALKGQTALNVNLSFENAHFLIYKIMP